MRLGTLLLRDAVISLTQLEQSLRAQILSGGLLGTNLVELGFIDVNTLGRYLARVLDAPLAIADRFEKADSALLSRFGAMLADRYTALPLGFEKNEPSTIGVAMCRPTDKAAIAAIEKELQAPIRPYVAPELRILYYLERYYGIKRRTRFVRAPEAEGGPRKGRRERRSTQPFRGISSPPLMRVEPRRRRESRSPSEPVHRPPIELSLDQAKNTLEAATDRQEIADALMSYCKGRFEAAALFLVRAHNAMGWRAMAPGLGAGAAERLNLPLGAVSSFQIAHDTARSYRGSAPSTGHPMESQLWSIFALEGEPEALAVVPILISGRVINLLYVHPFPGDALEDEQVRKLEDLCDRSGQAYRRLIAASKAQG